LSPPDWRKTKKLSALSASAVNKSFKKIRYCIPTIPEKDYNSINNGGWINMLAKRIKTKIGKDKILNLHVPDLPQGEVEIIILSDEKLSVSVDKMLALVPRHRAGKIKGSLKREDFYSDER